MASAGTDSTRSTTPRAASITGTWSSAAQRRDQLHLNEDKANRNGSRRRLNKEGKEIRKRANDRRSEARMPWKD